MSIRIDDIAHGTRIDEIVVPPKLRERYPFHTPTTAERLMFVTNLYGGQGITPSTVTLLTGTPGSGKSTLAIQMAHALHQRKDCMVLFNGGEESLFQTRLVCERLFKSPPTFYVGQDSLVDPNHTDMDLTVRHAAKQGIRKSILGHAALLRKKHPDKHLVIIHDSLQTADDGKLRDGATNNSTVTRALKLFNQHAKTTFDSVILIGQVTKNGDAAGTNKIIHDIDVHIHMYVDIKDKSETQGMRIIATKKNRYGYSGQAHILSMWQDGLKEEGSLVED